MRILAVMIGLVLVGFPLQLIYAMTVPVPQFRTGTYNDFTAFAATMGVIYGGAFVGIAIRWARNGTASRRVLPVEVLTAGVSGALALCAVFLVGSGVRSLITEGSFEKGIGNLWGLIVIVALVLGAVVSGGLALLFYGARRGDGR